MKNATKTEMLAAIPAINLHIGLLNKVAIDGYPAGTIRPVYGGNLAEGSIYVDGHVPKDWRMAVDTGDLDNEVFFLALPDRIEEIIPEDYPGVFELVISEFKLIPKPENNEVEPLGGRVITHPAVFEARLNLLKRQQEQDPAQLFLFPESEPKSKAS
jgi:hypothetical protein